MIEFGYARDLRHMRDHLCQDWLLVITESVEKQGVSETSNKGSNPSSCLKPHATYADAVRGQQQHKQ